MSSEIKRKFWGALLLPCPLPSLCSGSPFGCSRWPGREGEQWKGPGDRGCVKIHELFDEFSLLGELEEEEEEEDDEKFIPVSPGGFVAVFCPLKLFRQTGHVSCFGEQTKKTKQEIRETGLETQ